MMRRMNNKKTIKVISIGLSVYMALSPMVVYADDLSEAEVALATQTEARDEAAVSVEQAVEDATAASEAQADFENSVIDIAEEFNNIENEVIKEAADAIVSVDMDGVDDALDKVTEILDTVDAGLTDEVVANEIEATADTLIAIYDAQASAALNALTAISGNTDAVTVSEDGTVLIDWNTATADVTDLYNTYKDALVAKNDAQDVKEAAQTAQEEAQKVQEKAQTAQEEALQKKTAVSDKVNELNEATANKNREAISDSKQNKSNEINEIIASVTSLKIKNFKKDFNTTGNIDGNIYKFFINVVENGVAYGCLTYYDADSQTILRKNFKVSAVDDIDYNYVPNPEWVKEDASCKLEKPLFGNGGNYIAAFVGEQASDYFDSNKEFKGKDVSDLMRDNVNLNDAIDARNEALNDLEKINEVLDKVEAELNDASSKAKAALKEYNAAVAKYIEAESNYNDAVKNYNDAVAMYQEVATLENELNNSEINKAKLEYVKAEVEVWRKQQVLDQVKEAINNANAADKEEVNDEIVNNEVAEESIETVINYIAQNLGVEPAAVENLVVQTIIDTENNYNGIVNNDTNSAVAGVNRNATELEEKEELANSNDTEKKEVVEEVIDVQDEGPEIETIEDNEVPLGNVSEEDLYGLNWWLPLIIALSFVTIMIFAVAKKNQKEN